MTSRRERPPSGRNNVTARGEGLPRYAQVRSISLWTFFTCFGWFLCAWTRSPSGYAQRPTSNSTEYSKIHQLTTKYCWAQCTILWLCLVDKWDSTTNERIERPGEECENDRWDSCIGWLQLVLSTKILLCECFLKFCSSLFYTLNWLQVDSGNRVIRSLEPLYHQHPSPFSSSSRCSRYERFCWTLLWIIFRAAEHAPSSWNESNFPQHHILLMIWWVTFCSFSL